MLANPYDTPRLGDLANLGLFEAGMADASGEELLEQALLDLAGLVDNGLRRLNRLVRAPQNLGNLLLLAQRRDRNVNPIQLA